MFGFFKKSDNCPIDESRRYYIEKCFVWLIHTFGSEFIKNKKVLTPQETDFPFKFVGDEENAYEVIDVIAPQMNIDPDLIEIEIYNESPNEIRTGGAFHSRIFLKQVADETYSAGLYWGKKEDGKYHIGLESKYLAKPEQMIATLAHELAHIKLLGEERLKKNNETLTDLTTIIFGLGIFGANSAFQFRNSFDSWGYSRVGYLTQMDWGYGLALLAFIKKEKSPDWSKFLTLNVKSDFEQSERFIDKNRNLILKIVD